MGKLALLTIGVATALALAPAAHGESNGTPLVQSFGPPAIPQQQGSSCDANYSGPCVPVASDVDCAGGSGNGPEYVSGPVSVVGEDVYGLDHDNDGTGCE